MTPDRHSQHRYFMRLMEQELSRQKTLFPRDLASMHEAYGVMLEEVDELWDEVKKKPKDRVKTDIVKELIQIAVMCTRTAAELNLIFVPMPDAKTDDGWARVWDRVVDPETDIT